MQHPGLADGQKCTMGPKTQLYIVFQFMIFNETFDTLKGMLEHMLAQDLVRNHCGFGSEFENTKWFLQLIAPNGHS